MIRALSPLALVAVLGACAAAATGAVKGPRPPEPNLAVSAFIDSAALHQAPLPPPPAPAPPPPEPRPVRVARPGGAAPGAAPRAAGSGLAHPQAALQRAVRQHGYVEDGGADFEAGDAPGVGRDPGRAAPPARRSTAPPP